MVSLMRAKPQARNKPLSDYVRKLIRDWERSGGELKTLAERGRFAKSAPSQVKSGKLGVGNHTIEGWAKAFGKSVPQLWTEAEAWWRKEGRAASDLLDEANINPKYAEVIAAVKTFSPATDGQLREIVARYGAPVFAERPTDWWVRTLLAEIDYDRRSDVDRQTKDADVKAQQKKIRAAKEDITEEKKPRPHPRRKAG